MIAAVAAALVAMGIYLQRGYQGYLRNASQTHGVQFDPTEPFTDSRQLFRYGRKQTIDVATGEEAVRLFGGGSGGLPSTPGGVLPGRMLATKVRTTTEWFVIRNSKYEAQ
jgi:hypothetical protein